MAQRTRAEASEPDVVTRLLADAALQSEAAISRVRALLSVLLVARYFLIEAHHADGHGAERTWLVLPTGLSALAFSAVFLHRWRRRRAAAAWLPAATVVDALVAFLGLLGNTLYPGAGYPGALRFPDTAILIVVTTAAGFRMSVPLALSAGALNGAGLLMLVAADVEAGRVPAVGAAGNLLMWVVLLIGATAIAAVSALRTRSLATAAAEETVRRGRAVRDLGLVLEGHHDAQGPLSSALLNADRLLEAAREDGGGRTQRLAAQLGEDLRVLAGCVDHLKQTADGSLTASLPVGEVDLGALVSDMMPSLRAGLPGLALEAACPGGAVTAMVAGQQRGVVRVLWNLLKNAQDGDGHRRAGHARVRVEPGTAEVALVVEDDGPGFGSAAGGRTMKPTGLGIGLESVRTIAAESGGRLEVGRSPLGGALVRVALPVPPRRTATSD